MHREIAKLSGHTIVCGWGRVGGPSPTICHRRHDVVIVDMIRNDEGDAPIRTVVGDATLDSTLREAGVERAGALMQRSKATPRTWSDVSVPRSMPELFIVARARQDESVAKLTNAGADRVVNPRNSEPLAWHRSSPGRTSPSSSTS